MPDVVGLHPRVGYIVSSLSGLSLDSDIDVAPIVHSTHNVMHNVKEKSKNSFYLTAWHC